MPAFTLADVEDSFRRLAPHVAMPVTAHVLGGAAMARWRVKPSTKDVDVVFQSPDQLAAFEAALAAIGARRIGEPPPDVSRAGARHLWETPDGMGWDLFAGNVMGFELIPSDYRSAEAWLGVEGLEIRVLAPSLVFVMKAITPRTRDIADMAELLSSGTTKAEEIVKLVRDRIAATGDHEWLARLYQGVLDMGRERGIDVRWAGAFEQAAWEAARRFLGSVASRPEETAVDQLRKDRQDH